MGFRVIVPRENGSWMNDWIRNLLFYSISVAISNQTYSSNRLAKRVSRSNSKILRVSYVQRKVQNAFYLCL